MASTYWRGGQWLSPAAGCPALWYRDQWTGIPTPTPAGLVAEPEPNGLWSVPEDPSIVCLVGAHL